MSLGPLMIGLATPELLAAERELLAHPAVGGVILFGRNFVDRAQLSALTQAIHAVREPRLLVAVDQEGGRVQRLRHEFTELPALRRFGEAFDRDAEAGRRLAREAGWLMAAELRAVGVDLSFAPVVDLDHGTSTVIGDRAFHRDPQAVATLAHAYVTGMREAGMQATAKHFPGHGAIAADSHLELPVDRRAYRRLRGTDLRPFSRLAAEGVAGVMMAHVVYPAVDPRPAGFAPRWIEGVLRRRLGFSGVVFSDDLEMAAAREAGERYEQRARAALDAGCDMTLLCNDVEAAPRLAEALGDEHDPVSQTRLTRLHGGHDPPDPASLRASARWREAAAAVARLEEPHTLDFDF